VDVAAVTRGPLQETVVEDGETRLHDRFTISSPVTGRLQRIDLRVGDMVQQHQTVARVAPAPLDQRQAAELQARLASAADTAREAKARLKQAEAALAQARSDRQRAQQLGSEGVISREQMEQAETAFATAQEELRAAEFRARSAEHAEEEIRASLMAAEQAPGRVRFVDIHAPVSGRVLRLIEQSERVVQAGSPLMEIGYPDGLLEVVADVLTQDAVRIRPGMPVLIEGWGGERALRAQVRHVEPQAFTKISALGVEEQRVNVIADFVERPAELGDAFRVQARVVTWESADALRVPTSALFRAGGQWAVFVVEAGRARRRLVEIGHRGDRQAEVLNGLAEGEQVIEFPPAALEEGARVRPRSPEPVR
jgi:HlyD family secretion protein